MANGVPAPVVQFLRTLIALVAIVSFAWMFGGGIYRVWHHASSNDSDSYVYVATALATLVGGIVAVGFGQPPPNKTNSLAARNFAGLGKFATSVSRLDWGAILGGTYAVVYVLLGCAAIATWVSGHADPTPPLIKNLATTFLGMAIPIISAFFQPQT